VRGRRLPPLPPTRSPPHHGIRGLGAWPPRGLALTLHALSRRQAPASQAFSRLPQAQGLYNPNLEKDNCGVGMIANLKKEQSHRIVKNALQASPGTLECMVASARVQARHRAGPGRAPRAPGAPTPSAPVRTGPAARSRAPLASARAGAGAHGAPRRLRMRSEHR